jgi:hypothetical protein
VGRSAHAEVHLERERLPPVVRAADHEKIDRQPADHPGIGQMLRHPLRERGDDRRIRAVGGEATARELLAAAPVKDLVVRREQLDRAGRRDLELDARAAEPTSGDPLFHDATLCGQLAQVGGRGDPVHVGDQALKALEDQRALAARAGSGQAGQIDDGVSLAGYRMIELDDQLGELGLRRP